MWRSCSASFAGHGTAAVRLIGASALSSPCEILMKKF
jgi:hypothetical protein